MKAIDTGFAVSWVRATGNLYPKEKRLYEDPYSEKMASPFYKFFLLLQHIPRINEAFVQSKEKSAPGSMGWFFCRFRYINDVLNNCISKKEIEAVVNLGAGADCRAYYTPGVESIRYFEVDHPKVIKKKKAKLKKVLGKLPEHVSFVSVDFEVQDLTTELKKAGYDLSFKTLFIWEGVTQYISKDANESTLKYVAQAAPGSKIVFTYILKSFIEGTDINTVSRKTMYKWMVKRFPLFLYGLDPAEISNYLSKYSLSLIEDVGSEDLEDRYMKVTDLGLKVKEFDIERISLAELKG